MKQRHSWINGNTSDTFIKDKTDKNTCSRCGLKRKLVFERTPFTRSYYVYYSFNIRETKLRPD